MPKGGGGVQKLKSHSLFLDLVIARTNRHTNVRKDATKSIIAKASRPIMSIPTCTPYFLEMMLDPSLPVICDC